MLRVTEQSMPSEAGYNQICGVYCDWPQTPHSSLTKRKRNSITWVATVQLRNIDKLGRISTSVRITNVWNSAAKR